MGCLPHEQEHQQPIDVAEVSEKIKGIEKANSAWKAIGAKRLKAQVAPKDTGSDSEVGNNPFTKEQRDLKKVMENSL